MYAYTLALEYVYIHLMMSNYKHTITIKPARLPG
jgi:hypothetical protein